MTRHVRGDYDAPAGTDNVEPFGASKLSPEVSGLETLLAQHSWQSFDHCREVYPITLSDPNHLERLFPCASASVDTTCPKGSSEPVSLVFVSCPNVTFCHKERMSVPALCWQ